MTNIENARTRIQISEDAIEHMKTYQASLNSPLSATGLVTDLAGCARRGTFDGLTEWAVQHLALDAIRTAIPAALAHLEEDIRLARDEMAIYRNPGASARRKAAVERYKAQLQRFENDFRAIADDSDRDLLHKEAESLMELAREARMVGHLRKRFKAMVKSGRHRGRELKAY